MRTLLVIAFAFATLWSPANAYDTKTKADLKAVEELQLKQAKCADAIAVAIRHNNVWQDENLSLQECRAIAMESIAAGQRLLNDSLKEDEDDDK